MASSATAAFRAAARAWWIAGLAGSSGGAKVIVMLTPRRPS